MDSLLESELPSDLYPYLTGQAVRSRGCTGTGVEGASFLFSCWSSSNIVSLKPHSSIVGQKWKGVLLDCFTLSA